MSVVLRLNIHSYSIVILDSVKSGWVQSEVVRIEKTLEVSDSNLSSEDKTLSNSHEILNNDDKDDTDIDEDIELESFSEGPKLVITDSERKLKRKSKQIEYSHTDIASNILVTSFLQGVPKVRLYFVFVIFSGSRAHTEELFIAIG